MEVFERTTNNKVSQKLGKLSLVTFSDHIFYVGNSSILHKGGQGGVMYNPSCQLYYIWNQLKPKQLSIPVRDFLKWSFGGGGGGD